MYKNTPVIPACVLIIQLVSYRTSANLCDDSRCSSCDSGRCSECLYGYWGPQCNNDCTSCWLAGCHKHTGRCHQCLPGWYTEDCDTLCPSTCRLSYDNLRNCDRSSGKCLEGCREGWWGATCNMTCSPGCKSKACYQEDSVCISDCMEGWRGPKCDCSDTYNCRNGRCLSGRCTGGCKDGWTGETCTYKCSLNCLTCHQSTTQCSSCKEGLYGPDCMSECTTNCVDNKCSMAGHCINGCISGFQGSKCETACPYRCRDCDQDTGNCKICYTGWRGLQCKEIVSGSLTIDQSVTDTTNRPYKQDSSSGCAEVKLATCAMVLMSSVVFE
ncbi:scavenger receptor class F member 1-like [Haliotis cracherodii]|uniref:scavenger receptor class F member 1-like n=1 Tax=Haliotis cracherodii TaxID=6455 RepID=UPI0039E79666